MLITIMDVVDLTILDGDWKYYPAKSGSFKKWFAPGLIRLLGKENQPLELENSSGKLLFPLAYLTQIEVPEGVTEINSVGIFWIGECVGGSISGPQV